MRRLLLLLFFSLAFCSALFSQVTLTEDEFNEIMISLNEAESQLASQAITIDNLERLLIHSERIINEQAQIYAELETSYRMQRIEKIQNDLFYFGIGVLTGTGVFIAFQYF